MSVNLLIVNWYRKVHCGWHHSYAHTSELNKKASWEWARELLREQARISLVFLQVPAEISTLIIQRLYKENSSGLVQEVEFSEQ